MNKDEQFSFTTRIGRPASEVFAWHERPGALGRLCPPWETIEVISAEEGVRDGARVTVRNKLGPFWFEWRVEHRDYVAGRQFRDVQLSGPFARWEHLHRITPDGPNACLLTDEINYRLPARMFGSAMVGDLVRGKLNRVFKWRHATTKADLEGIRGVDAIRERCVLVAGASGVIGQALIPFLQTQGHRVVRLVRRSPRGPDEIVWNPARGELAEGLIEGVDAIVNLSGENVAGGRWTDTRRNAIMRSRVDATRTLVGAIQRLQRKPAVFISASAIGFYGDRGDECLTEGSRVGQGFLPEVCLAWETHAEGARIEGVRTVLARLGVVLTPAGGALAKLLPVFVAGLGGPVGGGAQWMSWIGIDDVLGCLHHVLNEASCEGALNLVSPGAITNRDFSAELARVLRRPCVVPVPGAALRLIFGEMADGTLLASARVTPERLLASGYQFRHPELGGLLRHILGR